MKLLRRKAVAFLLLSGSLSAVLAPTSASADELKSANRVEQAFPQGLPAGGTAVDGDTVSFEEGDVLLQLAPMAFSDCPDDWVCLWQDRDFRGRMLQFREWQDGWQNLTNYGFNDEMSSWRNRKNKDARWAWHTNGDGTRRCMNANSSSSYVGNGDNDEASSIRIYSDGSFCG